MKKQEILDIAKELIKISAKFAVVKDIKQKRKLLKIFENFEEKLVSDKTKYSKTILGFLLDLKEDLESWKKLNIDNLSSDEYLENYLLVKHELNTYNKLIDINAYRIIFNELNKKNPNNKIIKENLEEFINIFVLNLKELNLKVIAQNLLIFISFDRIIAKKYLKNLFIYLKDNEKQKIYNLLILYNNWLKKIKDYSIYYYRSWKINYKYLGFKNENWKTILDDKIIDYSKIWERTGFVKYEYLKLIKLI